MSRKSGVGGPGGAPALRHAGWVKTLIVIVLLQCVASFLLALLPVLSPALSQAQGWQASAVGYYTTVALVGTITFLLFGAQIMTAIGAIRTIQLGFVLGLCGIGLLFVDGVTPPALASLLFGIAYATVMPASSQVLQAQSPARHLSLVFSIKQAGVPMGAAFAGIFFPFLASRWGPLEALLGAASIMLGGIVLAETTRRGIDGQAPLGGWRSLRAIRPGSWMDGFRALGERPGLLHLAFLGAALAVNQGCWNAFLVVFLVKQGSLDLPMAGLLFSMLQISAVAGRLLLGFAADRLGGGRRIVSAAAILSGPISLLLVFLAGSNSVVAIAILLLTAGAIVTGWNGAHLAALATTAGPRRATTASSGALVMISLGSIIGQFGTATLASLTGRLDIAFLLVASVPTATALLMLKRR